MCGICGIFERSQGPVERATVMRMADSIRHRGPDDDGYHFEPGLGFGHRRLSIIDLGSGRQPIFNEDGNVCVIFNGEIYNYQELRSLLIAKGHVFRTNSDTEVIVHLYEEAGEDCFRQLRGMFAIALWDRRKRALLLARDRIGKKPLFYSWDAQRCIFGSELKAVLAHGQVKEELDPAALADYFCFLYIPAPKTVYRAVRKVRAAHYVVITENGMREQPYWDLAFDRVEQKSEERWCEELLDCFCEAVRVRLVSEVPLGSFLSGGIDSSAVEGAMSRFVPHPVTCTVGFDERAYSEVEYARLVAKTVDSEYHEVTVRPNALEVLGKLAWHYDEPFADSSAVPTYYVSQAAREHVTVALSGDGGDENFAGYKRYLYDVQDNSLRSRLPAPLRSYILRPLGSMYPHLPGAPRIFRAKSMLERMGRDPLEGYLASISVPAAVRRAVFTSDFSSALAGYDPLEQFREHYRRAGTDDHLSRIQYLDVKTYLTDDICVKVDRASMAVSLEVRAPLLDHVLMEFAAGIPSALKLRQSAGKYIFKKAVRPLLPASILERGKQGFGAPVAEWFRGELRQRAEESLFAVDGVVDPEHTRQIWLRHQSGIQDHSALLWAILMYRQWQQLPHREGRTTLNHSGAVVHA